MKHSRLIILFLITILVVFQSVDGYSANSLKEIEMEESVSNECVVSALLNEVKIAGEVCVSSRKVGQLPTANSIAVHVFRQYDLFLRHRSLLI